MIRYHLTVKFYNEFFQWKLDTRWKINSVWFNDYDLVFQKILNDMDWSEINKFKLNLFNKYKDEIRYLQTTEYRDWSIYNGYSIPSIDFDVSSNLIALCLPSRSIRNKYFEFDCLRERYFLRSDFIFHITD